MPLRVATALSPDLTMLVPADRVLSPAEASCRDLDAILPRLREAAVRTVLAVDALSHPELEPDGRPGAGAHRPAGRPRLPPARPAAPRRDLGSARVVEAAFGANDVSLVVESAAPAASSLRDGWAPGWTARVDGRPPDSARADGTVRFRCRPGRAAWTWPTVPLVSSPPSR